jgi:hypothetical protein
LKAKMKVVNQKGRYTNANVHWDQWWRCIVIFGWLRCPKVRFMRRHWENHAFWTWKWCDTKGMKNGGEGKSFEWKKKDTDDACLAFFYSKRTVMSSLSDTENDSETILPLCSLMISLDSFLVIDQIMITRTMTIVLPLFCPRTFSFSGFLSSRPFLFHQLW